MEKIFDHPGSISYGPVVGGKVNGFHFISLESLETSTIFFSHFQPITLFVTALNKLFPIEQEFISNLVERLKMDLIHKVS